jgi:twitching motility protein PilT
MFRHDNQPFRGRIFRERGNLAAAIRVIPTRVPTLDDLLPEEKPRELFRKMTRIKRGLVIVTGETGSGKTTTIAAMLEEINRTRAEHIITIEKPMEYEFESKQSVISQRSMGDDFRDYPSAVRSAMFMDPDVIWVGELQDLETLHLTLALADTGHLVFSSMRTSSASLAINRLIEAFPEAQQPPVRNMLSRNLQFVIAQQLLPRATGHGRVPAFEILICTPRVRQMIQEGYTDFTMAIEAQRDIGMQTMDDAIMGLFQQEIISREMAYSRLTDKSCLTEGE